MTDPADLATTWLDRTYGSLVVLADAEPIEVSERAVLLGCRYADSRDAGEPMLAATLCVPRDGSEPVPVAKSAPFDEDLNLSRSPGSELRPRQSWRAGRAPGRRCGCVADRGAVT